MTDWGVSTRAPVDVCKGVYTTEETTTTLRPTLLRGSGGVSRPSRRAGSGARGLFDAEPHTSANESSSALLLQLNAGIPRRKVTRGDRLATGSNEACNQAARVLRPDFKTNRVLRRFSHRKGLRAEVGASLRPVTVGWVGLHVPVYSSVDSQRLLPSLLGVQVQVYPWVPKSRQLLPLELRTLSRSSPMSISGDSLRLQPIPPTSGLLFQIESTEAPLPANR